MAHERNRKPSKTIEEIKKKYNENPIVERLEDEPKPGLTTQDHIKELQERLIKTCIDYINEKNLTDIYSVKFSADSLDLSALANEWTPSTDSYINVKGMSYECYRRKDGTIFKMPYWYDIGENY